MFKSLSILLVLLQCSGVASTRYPKTSESKLYHRLMDDYEKNVRPTPNHRILTNVTFGFLLHQVVDVAEKNQILTTRSWLNINWLDSRLSWNSSKEDNIELMYISDQKIWKPDIFLLNNADPKFKDSWVSTEISVNKRGNVSWFISAIFRSSCSIRVRFYPFDFQECNLTFASWSHHGKEIDLKLISEEGDLSSYVSSTEFDLLSMSAKRDILKFPMFDHPWPTINIVIRLERRPLFYVFNHILPCVLISSMAMLGFYVPPDTGEKVTMCITTMLSMGVYLKTVTEQIPPTAEAVPLIGVYYVVSLFVVCAATVANVFTLNLFNYGRSTTAKPVPDWIKRWILGYMATVLCIRVPEASKLINKTKRPDSKVINMPFEESVAQAHEIAKYGKKLKNRHKKQSKFKDREAIQLLEIPTYQVSGTQVIPGIQASQYRSNSSPHTAYPCSPSPHLYPSSPHPYTSVPHPPHHPSVQSNETYMFLSGIKTSDTNANISIKTEFEDRFKTILKRICKTLELSDIRQAVLDERSHIVYEWKMMALIFDRLLLLLFIIATTLTTVLILFEPAFVEDTH